MTPGSCGIVSHMPTIDTARLETTATRIFERLGAPAVDAAWIARLLVRANLRGHDSHGVIRIPQYAQAVKTGTIDPKSPVTVLAETPVTARLDGGRGFGQVVARQGIELCIAKAKASGLAAVGIPGEGGPAMVLDFATSVVAEGKMRVKKNRKQQAPPGWFIDAAGRPATDPEIFYGDPVGSLLTAGEHKGYGLSLAVEILGGILSGTGPAGPGPGLFANGTLMICLDVARFVPLPEFHKQVAGLFSFVKSAPLAQGSKEILIPGEPEARLEAERRRDGVPVEDETWNQIEGVAAELGVS